VEDSTKFTFPTPPGGLIDLISNPSPKHSNILAYISRKSPDSRYGKLWIYDLASQRRKQVAPEFECTCMTFSQDGDTLMVCTQNGEALYYDVKDLGQKIPLRRPAPVDLPEPEGDATWSISRTSVVPDYSYSRSALD
jgi:WD40 repeat protein